ncbi:MULTISPECIES: hypothetical protein [Methylobacteriaceae]|jgi:hypothetical protein|uniref:Uncharacterized protein n=7 Tax=Methylobacteriaceae TaxID=119045 RepID=A0A509EJ57_9HYPH|nr:MULTISPECIES: hypothetical protein [Methylobacteriaceae]ACS40453.1 conserved hypothetical protein [Methylorubrum extorquens AM1]MBD8906504.1 hypothetical protein [Methylorubrum zatmanii]MCP1541401.1 hypothetical protein [Methylorubrum extorquens]MCP1586063.1 hypothetical protein [Methylorubrum extorquens]MDQ0440625.1 hypothetical protein [Methylobacterium persicinum]
MFDWLRSLLRRLWLGRSGDAPRTERPVEPRHRQVTIRRYGGGDRPPPLHWKACHPSTVRRFKAEMTCSQGHALVLKDHTVTAEGRVLPSVVCQARGCTFHEFVRLDGWAAGELR